jgi:phenylalanyl-tRNA synthetase beta chain
MRVPLSWLGEYVDLEPGTTPEQVHAALVKVGFEEEDIHDFDLTGPLVVGQVLEFTPEEQSNGKTIRWCQVQVGKDDVRGIVCGASNFEVGDKVVVTLPGAVLPGNFEITPRKTYGHTSDGMMASFKELGLGDDHSGIIRLNTLGLPDSALEIGADAISLLGLDDSAVEINVTPDRGYAFSIRGVAREYGHSTGATFRDPAEHLPATGGAHVASEFGTAFSVTIDDKAPIRGRVGASVFATRVVTGVDASRPTPPWMVARLRLAGIRPISLVVDITNYVMLELGQPIHGYDLDKLSGGLVVRRATAGEKLTTLDGVERTLHVEDLLITDGSGPIGLAGVMGGASTEITTSTTNVLVEAANFDPVSIARTARRHKLPSEASKRFERGVDPKVAAVAAGRVVQLLVDLAGGSVADHGSHSVIEPVEITTSIELPAGFVSGLIGYEYTPEQIRSTLAEIGGIVIDGRVDPQGRIETFSVTPPSWRPDLTDKWTLAEEVARIFGYDVIPVELPVAPPGRGYTVSQVVRRRVSDALAAAGLTETLSYPFFDEATNNLFGSPDGAAVAQVRLANALDASQGWMRTSLLPGLLQTAARNRARGLTNPAIFELGLVFKPEAGVTYGHEMFPGAVRPTDAQLAAVAKGLPPQPRHIAAVLVGESIERQPGLKASEFDYSHALEVAQQISLGAGVEIRVRQGSHANFHPGRCAELVIEVPELVEGVEITGELVSTSSTSLVIGYAGEIHPSVAESFNLPRRVAAIELNLDAVTAIAGEPAEAQPLYTMPAATQDLSLVVSSDVPAEAVLAAVVAGAGDLLEDARLVDIYEGQGVAEGHRSLTFALRFRASDRTLTQAEATEAKQAGVAAAAAAFGATIRE